MPVLRYQLGYLARSSLVTLGITVAVIAVVGLFLVQPVSEADFDADVSVGVILRIEGNAVLGLNISPVLMVTIFIVGIVGIREDIKFMLQHGVGRRTTYLSTFLGGLINGAWLGLVCELLNMAIRSFTAIPASAMPFPAASFFGGWLMHMGCLFFALQFGVLVSLIYYRLNRLQQIILSVAAGAIVVFALPNIFTRFFFGVAAVFERAMQAVTASPFALACLMLLAGIIAAAANFLLLRRAQVKE
jgi:hypothetical protein